MTKNDLKFEEYHPYYQPYVDKAEGLGIMADLKEGLRQALAFIRAIPENKHNFRYADGKWSVKEVVQHLIDTERVFAYRALCIARHDKTNLPGFDQDDFVSHSRAANRNMTDLIAEYQAVRMATIALFESFEKDVLTAVGRANNSLLSVRAIAFIIAGHEKHHLQIIKVRYL